MHLAGAQQKDAARFDGKFFKIDGMRTRTRYKIKHCVIIMAVRARVIGEAGRQLFEAAGEKECAFAGNVQIRQADLGHCAAEFCVLQADI